MAYANLLHFMTQLSRLSLLSLGGDPFVWKVRFENFSGYVWVLESYFGLCANGVVNFYFFIF